MKLYIGASDGLASGALDRLGAPPGWLVRRCCRCCRYCVILIIAVLRRGFKLTILKSLYIVRVYIYI